MTFTRMWYREAAKHPRGMDRRRRVNPSVCLSMLGSCVLLALYVLLRVLS